MIMSLSLDLVGGVPSASTAAPCIADNVTANPTIAQVVPTVASDPASYASCCNCNKYTTTVVTDAHIAVNTTVTVTAVPPALPTLNLYDEVSIIITPSRPSQHRAWILTWNATAAQVNNPRPSSKLSKGCVNRIPCISAFIQQQLFCRIE